MRNLKILIISLLGLVSLGCRKTQPKDSQYYEIDREIENVAVYEGEKERRIDNLKERLHKEQSPDVRIELINWLIAEYESYISDSALYYINLNLENPRVKENRSLETALLIKKADVAAHAGLFGEASDILEAIDRQNIPADLLEDYYSAYCDLYQYQSEYATDSEYAENHAQLRELYIDSVGQVAPPSSISFVVNQAASEARNGNFPVAEKMLKEHLEKYRPGERNYSILASILADTYKNNGDKKNYHYYISQSVISDIKGAVKENMAMRALATECYEQGDLERADRYLRQSFADANFYAARMRNAQSSRMLPIIGESYNAQQKKLNHQLRLFIIFISILAFGFILIAVVAIIQVRKIRAINKQTKGMLDEVSSLSEKLANANKQLNQTNKELQASDALKGEYGILFMEYCSLAISSLQQYQQSLKVAAAQGNFENLRKKIDSANIENKTLAEFYSKFDEAVLNLYPNFVEKFNSLLKPEERVELKPKEMLNTELRVFALIRIGITDSEKIANFLRCSLSTIYTYRSKMKKKALNPDTFEQDLSQI
ncbi:MAG: hypothetical protein J1E16_07475 [Muribaculaceae bacterium]|nr:hypothetical protein [Muribaculaceae bacterium]